MAARSLKMETVRNSADFHIPGRSEAASRPEGHFRNLKAGRLRNSVTDHNQNRDRNSELDPGRSLVADPGRNLVAGRTAERCRTVPSLPDPAEGSSVAVPSAAACRSRDLAIPSTASHRSGRSHNQLRQRTVLRRVAVSSENQIPNRNQQTQTGICCRNRSSSFRWHNFRLSSFQSDNLNRQTDFEASGCSSRTTP